MRLVNVSAECKELMAKYMRCLRENRLENTACRPLAKDYLQCRIDRFVVDVLVFDILSNVKYVGTVQF